MNEMLRCAQLNALLCMEEFYFQKISLKMP